MKASTFSRALELAKLAKELRYSPPPYNLVFLHRKLAGVYSILKGMEVKIDVSPYWQKMTELTNQWGNSLSKTFRTNVCRSKFRQKMDRTPSPHRRRYQVAVGSHEFVASLAPT